MSAIELGDNVGGSDCLADNYHRSDVPRLRLPVQCIFDSGIANKNQSSGLEVEVRNSRAMPLLKLFDVLSPKLGDGFSHVLDVLRAFGKLGGSESDQFLGGDAKVLRRGKVGCFEDVEWE